MGLAEEPLRYFVFFLSSTATNNPTPELTSHREEPARHPETMTFFPALPSGTEEAARTTKPVSSTASTISRARGAKFPPSRWSGPVLYRTHPFFLLSPVSPFLLFPISPFSLSPRRTSVFLRPAYHSTPRSLCSATEFVYIHRCIRTE